jgi:hypothetical protein
MLNKKFKSEISNSSKRINHQRTPKKKRRTYQMLKGFNPRNFEQIRADD